MVSRWLAPRVGRIILVMACLKRLRLGKVGLVYGNITSTDYIKVVYALGFQSLR